MLLDLRKSATFSVSQIRRLSEIEKESRLLFNDYLKELCESNTFEVYPYFLQTTNRNTYVSSIYENFCKLSLLSDLLKNGQPITKVIVDTRGMLKAVISIIQGLSIPCEVQLVSYKSKRLAFTISQNIIKSFILSMIMFFIPKTLRGRKTPPTDIILVDTFILPISFSDQGDFNDRYFENQLNRENENNIWYFPALTGFNSVKGFYRTYKNIRNSSQNFILIEDYLKWYDYIYAIYLSIITPKKVQIIPMWCNIDVHCLIKHDLKVEICSLGLLRNILRFIGCKRLREANLDIKLFIDWFENQSIDRALILGIKYNYPHIPIKGYVGYIAPNYFLCQMPTTFELENNLLPHAVYVVGSKLVSRQKIYCPNLCVKVAPAFRFTQTYKKSIPDKIGKSILIALPISVEESSEILNFCTDLIIQNNNKIKFYIKFHPAVSSKIINKILPEKITSYCNITNAPIGELLSNVSSLISATSSVCVEAAVRGVSVAIIGSRKEPIKNPMENLIPPDRWSVCYRPEELKEFVRDIKTFSALNSAEYFEPVSQSSIDKLLSPIL